MTLQTLRSIHSGQVEAAFKVDLLNLKFWEKSWKNDWSKVDPESFQEGSQSSRTSKTIMKNYFKRSWAFRKKFKISTKTYHLEQFWDSFFAFSPCWRMCCPAGGLEVNLKWLVEHIPVLLKSNTGSERG